MGVNILLSYAFHDRTDLARVRKDLVCGRLMIDSGAFTAFTKGRKIPLDSYSNYLETWRGCWDHAITLDVIGDGKATAANTRKLHARGLPVMPVFTMGDTLADFDAMVKDTGYICVGGTVGLPLKHQLARVRMLQRRALDLGGGIHALGVGSMTALRAARPYSADASSVSGAFRFGTVVFFDGREIRNTSISDRAKLTRNRDHLRAHGVDLAQLARTQRMPNREQGSIKLMQAMSLAYACADEVLKDSGPVAAPVGLVDHGTHLFNSCGFDSALKFVAAGLDASLHAAAGTHLYNSVTPDFALAPAAGLDRELHGEAALPRIWRMYGRTHQCRQRVAA